MHPALSVIFFTVFSGFGYGLIALLNLFQPDPSLHMVKAAYLIGVFMISLGLASSTFHLKNPSRAWRAFSQWRSSWLSREGVLAVLTFVPLSAQLVLVAFLSQNVLWLGILLAMLCLATILCTAMIYASLKTVHAWHTPLTVMCYFGFALAGGALFLSTITLNQLLIYTALSLLCVSWLIKYAWYLRLESSQSASTIATATGLGHLGQVRLLERPHSEENYLTCEMGFKIARKYARKLRGLAYLFGLGLPALLLLIMLWSQMSAFGLMATAIHLVGMVIERWLFFAEAKHTVSLYYGARHA